jgi:hypothetical protein
MPQTLKYPFNPATPTVALQIIIDTSLAKPVVAESTTIGFPFELTLISFSASPAGQTYDLQLLTAINPYSGGDPYAGSHLIDMRGDTTSGDPHTLEYYANTELVLMPRARVPTAGRRLRLVQTGAVFDGFLRALCILTPLA